MWPFRRADPPPWAEETLQRMHAMHLELERRLASLEHGVGLMAEGVVAAKAMERRTGALEVGLRQLAAASQEDAARLQAAIDVTRGYATGGRGGRPRNEEREAERQALELGQRVIQAMTTPEGRMALIHELQGQNGQAHSPV
jgi:hypothetical protein